VAPEAERDDGRAEHERRAPGDEQSQQAAGRERERGDDHRERAESVAQLARGELDEADREKRAV
jgi:hypothetical protein